MSFRKKERLRKIKAVNTIEQGVGKYAYRAGWTRITFLQSIWEPNGVASYIEPAWEI